jgi:hypothetical protein
MSEKPSVGEQVYSGLADYGKVKAGFNIFTTMIIGIIMLVIGIILTRVHRQYNADTNAKIVSAACAAQSGNSSAQYKCDLSVEFTHNSIVYKVDGLSITSGTKYVPGNNIKIHYNKSDPNEATLAKFNNLWGWGLIILAIFVMIYSIVNFWLTTKYKGYAAFEGASSVAGSFGGGGRSVPTGSSSGINLGNLGFDNMFYK